MTPTTTARNLLAMRRLLLLLLVTACASEGEPPDPLALALGDPERLVDLTHPFDASTIYWPTATPFRLDTVALGMTPGGFWYEAMAFSAAEHGGTHLDAPSHFAQGAQTADEIPLSRLVAPAVVVDVSASAVENRDYQVTVADLEAFEATHGQLGDGVILLIRTGWAARWPDPERYLGTAERGADAVADLHFPGIRPDAARWLVENRSVSAVGIDTPSIDYGQSTTFDAHQVLYAENIPGFENVANLERLPATGAWIVALPMKIAGGSGGPLRIVAVLPEF